MGRSRLCWGDVGSVEGSRSSQDGERQRGRGVSRRISRRIQPMPAYISAFLPIRYLYRRSPSRFPFPIHGHSARNRRSNLLSRPRAPPRNSFEMGTDNGEKSLSKRDKIIKIIISCVSRVSCCLLFQFDDSRRALFLVQIFRIMMLRCYDVDEDWKNSYLCINIRTLIIYIYI